MLLLKVSRSEKAGLQASRSEMKTVAVVTNVHARQVAQPRAYIEWVKRPDGTTEYVDAKGAAFVGLAPEDICGRSWFELLHPDDVDAARVNWEEALREQTPYETELRMRNAGGEYRWMAECGSPVFAPDGTINRWVGTLADIDDSKQAEASLRRSDKDAAQTRALLDTVLSSAPVGFLFLDREFRYVRINEKVAAILGGATVYDHLGLTVAEVVPTLWPQLEPFYRRVLESGEPVINVELNGETAEDPGHVHYWLESIYPIRVGAEVIGLGVIFIDITERKEGERALIALTETSVDAIAAAAEARDPYTAGHQRRVADLSVAIAGQIGMDQHDIEGVRLAAKIHDIGKLSMPSEILSKPSALKATETALLREHAQAGSDIVRGIDFPWPIADMILQHHERIDGSGYPSGLVGAEILLGARIIAVADVVEAMVSHRPYRPSKGLTAALSQIEHDRGSLFDSEIVDACLRLFRQDGWRFQTGDQSGGSATGPESPIGAALLDDDRQVT
jgi:PAS domain S-box-containing protein/putative nucleotidyltransferase with HDIG domain